MWLLWTSLAAATDLSGTWRVDLHLVHEVSVPVLGTSRSDSHTVQLWRVDGDQMRNEHCSITAITRRRIGRPTIPTAFARAIEPAQARMEVTGDTLRVDMGLSRIGHTGPTVPEAADDPAVVDHEGDGLPGATMSVWAPLFGDVELYVAQRTHLVLDGVIDGERVTGTARQAELVQRTLGAANRLFVRNPVIVPVPDDSSFTMVRVPEGTTCDTLPAG